MTLQQLKKKYKQKLEEAERRSKDVSLPLILRLKHSEIAAKYRTLVAELESIK